LSLADARSKIERWRRQYNESRPHTALGSSLSRPLISIPLAAKELKFTPQAVEGMLKELSSLRELTGRGRYRPWGIV
jgi:hypothetical protein